MLRTAIVRLLYLLSVLWIPSRFPVTGSRDNDDVPMKTSLPSLLTTGISGLVDGLYWSSSLPLTSLWMDKSRGINGRRDLFSRSFSALTSARTRQTNTQTSHMARCVTFTVARIRVKGLPLEIDKILHIFPSGPKSMIMGNRGSKKVYMVRGCDRSIVVGCRSRNDRQTSRQTDKQTNRMEWQ